MTLVRNGAIVSYDRREFFAEVEAIYGEDTADAVRFADLPSDERLHVEQHRRRLERDDED